MHNGRERQNTISDIPDSIELITSGEQEIISQENILTLQHAISLQHLPISYRKAFKQTLATGGSIFSIVAAVNLNTFLSGLILSDIDRTTLAATSLINAEKLGVLALFAAPITALGFIIGHDIKANASSDDIARTVQAGYLLALGYSIPAFIIFSSTKPILIALGQETDIAAVSQSFFLAFLPGTLAYFIRFNTNHFANGLNKRLKLAPIEIASSIISLPLTYILVLGKFGAPKLGALGYGLAQSVENCMSLIGYQSMVFLHKDFANYKLFKPRWNYLNTFKRLLKKGAPVMLAYAGEQAVLLAFPLMAGVMGENQLIAQNVLTLYLNLLTPVSFALFVTSSVLHGRAYGAKQISNIKRYTTACLSISLVLPLTSLIIFSIKPTLVMRLLIDPTDIANRDIVNMLETALPLMAVSNGFDSIRLVLAGALLGMQDINVPTLVNFATQLLIAITLMYTLGFHTSLEVAGTMAGYGISSFALVLFCLYRWNARTSQIALEIMETQNEGTEQIQSQHYMIEAVNNASKISESELEVGIKHTNNTSHNSTIWGTVAHFFQQQEDQNTLNENKLITITSDIILNDSNSIELPQHK
jgi:MATE family multidrug resistance protein